MSFVEPAAVAADAQNQREWAVSQASPGAVPEDLDPQFELPPHLAEFAEGEEEPAEPPENPDPYAEFDPAVREDVIGLEYLGHLEDQFSFCGHGFVIKTLHGDEDLAAAVAIQPLRGTLREPEAWIWAQVAMSLKTVDNDENFCPPIGPDINDFAAARLRYCTNKWFYPLAEHIYFQHFVPLQDRQRAAIKALQGKSLRNRLR